MCSLPGSSVRGILQASVLEWVAIPFSRGSSQPGIELEYPAFQADSLPAELPGKPILVGTSFEIPAWSSPRFVILIFSYFSFET